MTGTERGVNGFPVCPEPVPSASLCGFQGPPVLSDAAENDRLERLWGALDMRGPGREEAALSSAGSARGLRQLSDDVEQFTPVGAALAADLFAVADW
jgi:hypothetical protein